jgi:release factor glutamine methyltransferase
MTGVRRAVRQAVDAATQALAAAGVDSARVDAEELAAHVAGVDRARLALLDDTAEPGFVEGFLARYHGLVDARSRRVPLQHLTGVAAFGPLLLDVGPGVFIPRPETEALLHWAATTVQALGRSDLLIVDLCTGSAALAVALARVAPGAAVFAVDDSAVALRYARRNAAGTRVQLIEADVTRAGLLPEFDGRVDLVVANPPYIPDGTALQPEVAEHDPEHALFGGPDGMRIVDAVVELAARWLRPGGWLGVEHDDTTSVQTAERLRGAGVFEDVVRRADLTGRPRFVTASRGHGREADGRPR